MTTATAEKQLSQSPAAIRSRARRAAQAGEKVADAVIKEAKSTVTTKSRKQPSAAPVKLNAAQKRTIGQFCASVAAGFLPIASYVLAHYESKSMPMLWVLVAAALLFSAPTLAAWAKKWCGGDAKAWGFTILLEGVMVFSSTEWLSFMGLGILIVINASNAYQLAAMKSTD